jgi:hypothetical protein
MIQLKKNIYRMLSMAPLPLMRSVSQVDVLLPYHHLVSDGPVPHIDQLYPYKNPKQFERDLDYLLRRFRPLDPSILPGIFSGGRQLPERSFLLSFDDGLREVHDIVAPMLVRKGVPAIFFLNPDYLDNRDLFYRCKISLALNALDKEGLDGPRHREVKRVMGLDDDMDGTGVRNALLCIDYLNRATADRLEPCLDFSFADYLAESRPFLTKEQVRQMIGQGFHFGGHSMDHPHYKLLPIDNQLDQTRRSCSFVRETFGLDYTFFSFPHEDAFIGQAFFDTLSGEDLFKDAVFFGTQNQLREPGNRMLHRFNAERPQYGIDGLVKSMLLYTSVMKARRRLVVDRHR